MIRIGIFILNFVCTYYALGQVYINDEELKEKHFIYEVKQIDEFFERFNNDTASFIRNVYRKAQMKFQIDRAALIKSLFNYKTKNWDTTIINDFVASVTDPQNPCNLDFYGENWFAELECKFKYNTNPITIPLILKVVKVNQKGAKWVIAGVGTSAVRVPITINKMPASKNFHKCIGPSSQAANFIALKKAFEDKDNLSNCFDESFFDRLNAMEFYNALLNNELEFMYVKSIKYHFLENDGWIFLVEYFPREDLNSGWLINYVKRATPEEMNAYKRKLLGYND
jgi:hypothetical protein